jgi:hypothetical protein
MDRWPHDRLFQAASDAGDQAAGKKTEIDGADLTFFAAFIPRLYVDSFRHFCCHVHSV